MCKTLAGVHEMYGQKHPNSTSAYTLYTVHVCAHEHTDYDVEGFVLDHFVAPWR